MSGLQAVRGMNDVLPDQTHAWQDLERILKETFAAYGYREIRLPILEKTELFARSIGEETDIVSKEMYTFDDRNGDSLTLRPEGTASCVRAGIQHGLFHNQQQRLWYLGPMFRYERPQRGRSRQFHQAGVEAVGWPGPDIDAELIVLTSRLWRALGLTSPELQINSLGNSASRAAYREQLVEYLREFADHLDPDSVRRLETNPLRILDSKDDGTQQVLTGAPSILDTLDAESRAHFDGLCGLLDSCGIAYQINPQLVRGLDYYNRSVFEWVTGELGAQGTVCAGGRYDALVEQLGGRSVPATGFAIGLERIVDLVRGEYQAPPRGLDVFVVSLGEPARRAGLALGERLRDAGLAVQQHCGEGGWKNQLKRADKSGAEVAVLIGDDEIADNAVTVKPLRTPGGQQSVPVSDVVRTLNELLNKEKRGFMIERENHG
ncbi:MAG: histidine--tRNA ligase [Gammaproteobacteria bacterium]|nr:histidine--tRNA ligase [Gammaproteobacteria bacterium]